MLISSLRNGPVTVKQINNTYIRDEACTTTFKKKLKTFYFSQAYDCN